MVGDHPERSRMAPGLRARSGRCGEAHGGQRRDDRDAADQAEQSAHGCTAPSRPMAAIDVLAFGRFACFGTVITPIPLPARPMPPYPVTAVWHAATSPQSARVLRRFDGDRVEIV